MAWDPLDDDAYSGDLPMDAFGTALARAAELYEATEKRRPYTSELAEALLAAIREAAEGTIGQRERADELLAQWIALPRTATKTKRPRAKAGDILAIPYAGDGAKQICGRVLFAPTKQQRGPGYGLCVVVHDLDLTAGTVAAAIRSEPILLGPFHVGDEEILEGRWRIVGNVDPDDAELPTFASTVSDGHGGWRPRVPDYFGTELADTPEHRARLVEQSIGPPSTLIIMIRMLRGLVRWLPSYAKRFGVRKP